MNRHYWAHYVMRSIPHLKTFLILIIIGTFFYLLAERALSPDQLLDSDSDSGFSLTMKIENLHEYIHLREKLKKSKELPTIYFITPTYKRPEQLPDLTRLAQTLMHVPSLLWFVIEDAHELTPAVNALLRRSKLKYLHMKAPMPDAERKKRIKARGVSNRNKGLEWIRHNEVDTKGVVYFGDDDNTYDLRLFPEIRSVKKIGMWPVGLLTQTGLSSPLVQNGTVTGFYDGWVGRRKYPVDMAGFAVSVEMVLNNPNATFPFIAGYEEDGFIKRLNVTLKDIEAKADNCTQIYAWHTKTVGNHIPVTPNFTLYTDTNIMSLYKQLV